MARYLVDGMTCDGCARAVSRALEAAFPGRHVEVNRASGSIDVPGAALDEARLRGAIAEAGFVYRGAV